MTYVTLERTRRVEVWTLGRPVATEFTGGRLLEIDAAAAAFDTSVDVDVLLIQRGTDVEDPVAATPSAGDRISDDTCTTLRQITKPVIAVVYGRVDADWLWLMLQCDLRLAAADATFTLLGVDGDLPGRQVGVGRLCDLVGRTRALEWLWFGRAIDAAEAVQAGLVTWVVPRDRLWKTAWERATALTSRRESADALRSIKRAVMDRGGEHERNHEALTALECDSSRSVAHPVGGGQNLAFWGVRIDDSSATV